MKKILFISNIIQEITNFTLPSIKVCKKLGIEFHLAGDLSNFRDLEIAEELGITLHHIDLMRNAFSLHNLKALRQLNNIIYEHQINFIHCNTPTGGVLGRFLTFNKNIEKVLYSSHGFHFYKGAPLINNIIFKSAEHMLSKFTDAMIVINKEDYEAASKMCLKNNGNLYYVPGVGIDTEVEKISKHEKSNLKNNLGFSENDIIVSSAGRIEKNKNTKTLILSIMQLNNPKIKLLICGEGSQKEEMQELVKKLGLEHQIYFLGFVDNVKEILAISDIFISLSIREGLPRSVMEAMAMGVPCVVSDNRGHRDLIENGRGGFLCNPFDAVEVSEATKKIIQSNELSKKMIDYNLSKIKQFDSRKVEEYILEIYRREFVEIE